MGRGHATDYDVAIIGLGPVGATLAGLLGQQGLRVLAVDAAPDIYDLPRAIGMDHEVLRVFQQLGIADALRSSIGDYRTSEYRTAEGEVIRRFISQEPPYPLAWPPYMTFVQPGVERILRGRLASIETLALHLNTELVALTDFDGAPKLTTRDAMGTLRTCSARFVVGCDGGNSFVRRSLGIAFEDLTFDQPWLVVDMLLTDPRAPLPEVNVQYCDPARPHTFVICPGNLRRWEFMLMSGEDPVEMARPETVWRLLSPWLRQDQATMWRSATYRFHAVVAERWRRGNVFLAGDACHMTPPFLAQGMAQGIKDALNLSWKLSAVCGGLHSGLLDTYEAERRPLVREVISITKELGRVVGECDPARAETRNRALRAEMATGRGVSVRQNLFPALGNGPLCRPSGSGSTAAGWPAPQPWIDSESGRARLDDLTGARLRLLALPEFPIDAGQTGEAARLGMGLFVIAGAGEEISAGHVAALREEGRVFRAWMNKHGATAIIVRPDHMVFAGLTRHDELAGALESLKSILHGASEAPGLRAAG